ncbi:MAG: TerB family tellurite resistance protein [Bacteroidetes bacterium]|nr:TerB family tellurite resistance protein [Bacteroidota bacterium]
MLELIKDLLTGKKEKNEEIINLVPYEKKLQIATCALFLEVANSDDNFAKEEKENIYKSMKEIFGLEEQYIKELISLSEEQIRNSVSLYEFTDIINQNFSKDEKYEVVKNLWKLIYTDNKVDKYEDLFIKRISSNFHLEHKDLIAAKLEVKNDH